jgi:hypothetical protein
MTVARRGRFSFSYCAKFKKFESSMKVRKASVYLCFINHNKLSSSLDVISVYLDANPSQVEPLLREIFDLKVK